jgi:nucleoside phosphorylase
MLSVELRALRSSLNRAGAVLVATINVSHKEEIYEIKISQKKSVLMAVVCLGAASNLDSAVNTLSLLYRYAPRYVYLFGIAGGLQPAKYKLGSVVIGSDVLSQKISKISYSEKYEMEADKAEITDYGQILIREFMTEVVMDSHRTYSSGSEQRRFNVYHEKIFSWDLVLNCSVKRGKIIGEIDRQLAIVEMEAIGFYSAIEKYKKYLFLLSPSDEHFDVDVDGMVVRGISDYAANKTETDTGVNPETGTLNWRLIAAENAAQTLVEFIRMLSMEDFGQTKILIPKKKGKPKQQPDVASREEEEDIHRIRDSNAGPEIHE